MKMIFMFFRLRIFLIITPKSILFVVHIIDDLDINIVVQIAFYFDKYACSDYIIFILISVFRSKWNGRLFSPSATSMR